MSTEYRITEEQFSKLQHDLSAPVGNANAFKSELLESVNELIELVDSLDTEISPEKLQQIKSIVNEDIQECAQYLGASIEKLQANVAKFFEPLISQDSKNP